MLKRDKALPDMSALELVRWIRKLCELWDFEYCQISTGLPALERELIHAMQEFLGREEKP